MCKPFFAPLRFKKSKVRLRLHTSQVAHQVRAYPDFCSMQKRPGVFLLPPEWDASPSQGYPRIKAANTHLNILVERDIVRVKCFDQEHNSVSPAKAPTWTTRSRVERTNHEATAPPTRLDYSLVFFDF